MTLVYATGQPRFFEFAIASNHRLLPADAIILATCDGERTTDLVDEYTFKRMTDEEYYELQTLINEAQQCEQARLDSDRKKELQRKFWESIPSCWACQWAH